MHADHIASHVAFRSAESTDTDEERAFERFCKKVGGVVGQASATTYEDDIYGMYEAGFSVKETADEVKHLAGNL